jgi:hypothetical protein
LSGIVSRKQDFLQSLPFWQPSTLSTCSKRLWVYFQWGQDRDIDPTSAAVAEVADFLQGQFESDLQTVTVRGYKSAIVAILEGCEDGQSVADRAVFRSFT